MKIINFIESLFHIKIEGITIDTIGLTNTKVKNTLSFVDNEKYLEDAIFNPNITCLFITNELEALKKQKGSIIKTIKVDDPRFYFFTLLNEIAAENLKANKTPSRIAKSAIISEAAYISPYDVIIGNNVIVEPNATILPGVEIGDNSIIRAGSVIGTEGFEHKKTSRGILSVLHDGKVVIGENAEIGSCAAIAKGFSFRNTIIGNYTKVDNLVHVAHGVQIGNNCLLPASCMIAGGVTIGDNVWIGPNASISSQLDIQNNAYVTIGSVVTKNVKLNEKVTGNFAISHDIFLKNLKKSIVEK